MAALWDRRDDESPKQYQGFLDYFKLGTARSLRALHEQYVRQIEDESGVKPPARTLKTIERWSSSYNWQERVSAWDTHRQEAQKAADEAAYQEMRDEARRARRKALHEQSVSLMQITETLKREVISSGDPKLINALVNATRVIVTESRAEFGDTPTAKHDVTSKGEQITHNTDAIIAAILTARNELDTNE